MKIVLDKVYVYHGKSLPKVAYYVKPVNTRICTGIARARVAAGDITFDTCCSDQSCVGNCNNCWISEYNSSRFRKIMYENFLY